MSNEKLSKLDLFTIGTLAALQFMQSVRQESEAWGNKKEDAVKEKTPEYKPKNLRQPIMKVGKMYELNNGRVIFCNYAYRYKNSFNCVPVGELGNLEYDEFGVCIRCVPDCNTKGLNVRRTWKKKYAKK